jgi:hypothetical protein
VEVSQTRAIADALLRLRGALAGRSGGELQGRSLAQLLDGLEAEMDAQVGGAGRGGPQMRRGLPWLPATPWRIAAQRALPGGAG